MGKEHAFLIENMNFYDINPVVAGWQRCGSGHSFGPAVRDYYLIHFVVSGKGVLYNSEGEHKISKNQVFIIKAGEITTYKADEKEPWHYIWIGFGGKTAKRLDDLPSVMPYYESTFFTLQSLAENNAQRELYLTGLIFEMLGVLTAKNNTTQRYEKLASDYIKANYMRSIKIEEIASRIGINQQYLARLFKGRYGKSMRDFLLETRLIKGARFLSEGKSVKETANLCGYEDVFNFSKMFKKRYGVSPKEYKKFPHTP